jgi:hypothetical protein
VTYTPIEYAVKMRQFSEEGLLDRVIARGALAPERIDHLARLVAGFHARIARAPEASDYGLPERAHFPVAENFHQTLPLVRDPGTRARLERLQAWSESAYARLAPTMAARRAQGFIRECHGDMHLGNMAEVDGEIAIFDGIEFNPNLSWIDVMSEVAFLCMDLDQRGRPDYAWRFLNRYLEHTGDYPGLALLRYYQAYRAMVRAKVTAIRLAQPGLAESERSEVQAAFEGYLARAEGYAAPGEPFLALTHGPSGTGKTLVAGALAGRLGAVHLRSDVERKRMAALPPDARSGSPVDGGLYTADRTRATYARLAELARGVTDAGLPAIVDATFLERWQRDLLRSAGQDARVPVVLLSLRTSRERLRERVEARERAGGDASEAGVAVLARQLESMRPLEPDEAPHALEVDTETAPDLSALADRVRAAVAARG